MVWYRASKLVFAGLSRLGDPYWGFCGSVRGGCRGLGGLGSLRGLLGSGSSVHSDY